MEETIYGPYGPVVVFMDGSESIYTYHPLNAPMMKGAGIAAIATVAVVLCLVFSYVTSDDSPTLQATLVVEERGTYLDISNEDLLSIGAYPGCDIKVCYGDSEHFVALYSDSHGGSASYSPTIRYSERSQRISIGIGGSSLTGETGLADGDTVTLKVIGDNPFYKLVPNYRAGSTDKRADYDDDQEFGNYRELRGGNLKDDTFYRSSNPWNHRSERAQYSDDYYREMGVENLICLDLDMAKVEERCQELPDAYATSLFEEGKVHAQALSPSVHSHPEQARFVLESLLDTDGSVGIFCTYGRDRTGAYCAMIESLAGATFEEVREDFMESLCNYNHIEKGSKEYEAVAQMYVDRVLYLYKHPEYIGHHLDVDWAHMDFSDYVPEEVMTNYLIDFAGMPPELVQAVKERITA